VREALMPNRNKEQQKTAKVAPREAKRPSRKLNFQNESWYAAAAQRMTAARSTERPLAQVPSPPLASE
jgi:hypothetical protein